MTDDQFMRRALELAEQGRFTVSPNPMVGCVLVRDGEVIAEGWHRRAGEAHAEIDALSRCENARGATMYVTLEPCSHHGRTPPCSEAVIASGIRRIVIAMQDPNELVDGRGIEAIRAAGIEVTVGLLEADARRQNETFLWSATHKLPFVLLKAAMTLDGKLATIARESQWITSQAAREASLSLREEYDAVLVGSGTVRSDNPRLTRRLNLAGPQRRWTRVILDGEAELPPHSQLFSDGAPTIVFTSDIRRYTASDAVELISTGGRADLQMVLGELHRRGIHSLLVEGGAVVHSEFIRLGLWQKLALFIAPMFVGGSDAPAILGTAGVSRLTEAYRFRFDRCEFVGDDLMVVAYPA
ncbi:MAG TPA: bifunctional diaminohydroxyphosphoribosylaminopyrimidine deaminase/5-amino-6-(5-phosphoribosylamino)uracil reductase RibD [Thermoanaerobaculia bacterium]